MAATRLESSDAELAAAGDQAAFARLVARYQPEMAGLAYTICGDRELALDATQSAWVVAWRRLGGVRDATRVRSWLLTVVANEARQILRRRGRVAVLEIDPQAPGPAAGDPSTGIARLDLVRALAKLAPEDRVLLALRYVAGMDAAELGLATGRTASGTRARLSRLTTRLRAELDR